MAADPIPAIPEAEATGEIAALYADIRGTLGVPMVNLVWRHLAATDGALAWAWRAVRPLYASGAVAATAAAFRDRLVLPPVPALAPEALSAAGIADSDRPTIRRILVSYDRGNTMNFVALGALQAMVRGTDGAGERAGRPPGPAVEGPLPPLPSLESLDAPTAALVRRLNAVGARDDRVVASLYRHLAPWPALLALLDVAVAPLAGAPALLALVDANRETGLTLARGVAASLETQAPPEAVAAPLDAALDGFLTHTLGRMVTMGRLIRTIVPG